MYRLQRACIWQLKNESPFEVVLAINRPTFSPYIYSTNKSARQYSTAQNVPCEIPASRLESKTHPLGWEKIQAQVEPYFGNNWSFASEKEKKGFLSVGLSRAFVHSFPLTLDDRIDVTCKMLYLSLLIDDQLETLSFTQMWSYRDRIMKVALGTASPDRRICLEWMLHDTVMAMRSMDEALANDVAHGFCQLLQAQTSEERSTIKTLGSYLKFREIDVGKPFFTALIRFGAKLYLTTNELKQTAALESIAFRHFSVMNDIYSWEREWKVHQANQTDGANPVSAIYIFANETGLPYTACKRMMYSYCRELELALKQFKDEIYTENLTHELEMYIKGLEYFMSGIELWSQWTPRYLQ
ncbi:hypothetical protein N7491_009554 [Penicillium cf. griseofulvum]|uniref:Uncharacterized protein n=1 Tax=Penicillium cf. griseofulvum TaxID=2972120 RepID=A0A9W9JME8_9EURO|nr:hypothetical protein N7472_004852 [Penicillium cf. griseofulvum]KAJ5424338.1 hypothetical protein N7491_009554 [Penicillium cf. griseofulvum]KAJ5442420.1 hypothetical protein N7445_005427 [Penicillium cf. griseofulvum]